MTDTNKVTIQLINDDCLNAFKDIPDNSVDMVLCDPPYGIMTGIGSGESSKNQGLKNCEWDVALDIPTIFKECSRVLKDNGNLILFSQEPYTSKLITGVCDYIKFSQRAIWNKKHFGNCLLSKNAMVSYYEDICVFIREDRNKSGVTPNLEYCKELRAYAKLVSEHIFTKYNKINADVVNDFKNNNVFGHYGIKHFLSHDIVQFNKCNKFHYQAMIDLYEIDKEHWFISYDEMCKLVPKKEQHKTFNLCGAKHKSNIFEYKKDNDGYHPTQKPIALLEDLLKTFSNEGATVLDFTMGSGSTGVACVNTNRNFIGIEMCPNFFNIANKRIHKLEITQEDKYKARRK